MPSTRRQTYQESYSRHLHAARSRLDHLRGLAERMRHEERLDFERALDDLRGFWNRANARLEDLNRAPTDAWKNNKLRADAALEDLQKALERIEGLLHPSPSAAV